MTQLDPFTLGLLTNDEVIDVDQDPLGKQAARVSRDGALEVWSKGLEDGSRAVGLFNRSRVEATIKADWSDVGSRESRPSGTSGGKRTWVILPRTTRQRSRRTVLFS